MKKFTIEETRMLLVALNHMQDKLATKADECRNADAVLSAQQYTERSNAYMSLFHKVSVMMDDITE